MKMSIYLIILSLLFMATHLHSEEPILSEKICGVSPDQKFAVRVLYDEKENEKDAPQLKEERTFPLIEGIFWPSVKAVDIVSLPAKEKVVELADSEGNGNLRLMWSADSRWCAFYQDEVNNGYTSVFNQRDGKFVKLDDLNDLHLKFKAFRKEWIEPIRWVKPGVLILHDKVAGDSGPQGFEVTVRFDEEGKAHVIGQKKLKESS